MIKCPSCGHNNKDNTKFCPECGFKLSVSKDALSLPVALNAASGAAISSSAITDELKLVTMLFADISGFTAMSGKLSPDEVKDIVDEIFEKLTTAIESEHGKVIKYEGDCIMASFGISESNELDPIFSCYAALKMQRELSSFSEVLKKARGFDLKMRIGIHTGRAVIGLIGGRLDIMGDAVNIAARMEQNAGIGKIMITADMAKQLKGRFLLETLEPVKVKGKDEPVNVYNVIEKSAIKSRLILDRSTEMVGRENELVSMIKKFEDVGNTSIPHMFFIEGPAGCGKSRLIQELEQYIHKLPGVIKLNKSFFNSTIGSDYRVFKVFFKNLDVKCDSEYELLDHLKNVMAGFDDKIIENYSKNMAYLLGLEYIEDEYIKRMKETPKDFIPIIFKAFEDYFTAMANNALHVFFIEDLHWTDDGSIKLIDHLLRWCAGKLYFVATSRKNLKEDKFKLPGHKITACRLNYLSGDQSYMMIKNILNSGAGIDEDHVKMIIEKIDAVASGNPLFIEELIISMNERGIIFKEDAGWIIDEEKLRVLSLPATVEMAIQARIESLSRENIDVLKKAAVIGRKFSGDALICLLNKNFSKDLRSNISELIKKGMLLHAGAGYFMFSHDTIRDVAYDKLTKKQKRELHGKTAEWLEGRVAEKSEDENFEALISFHFDMAGNKEKTVHYAHLAAKISYEKYQVEDCIHYYELIKKYLDEDGKIMDEMRLTEYLEDYSDALLLAGKNNELLETLKEYDNKIHDDVFQIKLNIKKIFCYSRLSDMENLEKTLNETEKMMNGPAGKKNAEALWGTLYERRGSFYETRGNWDLALDHYEKALKIYENAENMNGIATILISTGVIYYKMGNFDDALSRFERSIIIYKKTKDKRGTAQCLNNLGMIYHAKGDHVKALDRFERSMEILKEIGDRRGAGNCLNNMGIVYNDKGDINEALDHYEMSLKIFENTGEKRMIANCLANIGIIYHSKQNYDEALHHHENSMAFFKEIGDRQGFAYCLNNIGNIYHIKRNYDGALKNYAESLDILEEIGNKYGMANCLAGIGTAYNEKGDHDQALVSCERSLAILEEIGGKQGIAMCLHFIGKIYISKLEYDTALDYLSRALTLSEENGYKPCGALCLKETGNIYMLKFEYDTALDHLERAKALFEELSDKTEICALKGKIKECLKLKG